MQLGATRLCKAHYLRKAAVVVVHTAPHNRLPLIQYAAVHTTESSVLNAPARIRGADE